MRSFVTRLAAVAFVIALPVLLITSNVRFLLSDVRISHDALRDHDAAGTTGIPLAELDRAAGEIIDYFENDAETLRIVVSRNGQEEPLFSEREIQHMADVKTLVRAVYRVNEVTLAIVLGYIACAVLWARERSIRGLAKLSVAGVAAGFASLAVVGAFALTGFDQTWNRFHRIAFSNDLWQLDPDTDRLIQMYPEPFWESATYLAGVMTLAEAAIIVIAATAYLLLARRSEDQDDVPRESGDLPGELVIEL